MGAVYRPVLKFAARDTDSDLPALSDQWASDDIDGKLRTLVNQAASYLYRIWNQDIVVTCLLRTPEEDKALYHDPEHEPGVHCYGRGADISTKLMSPAEIDGLVEYLNGEWIYDPDRPTKLVAMYETGLQPGSTAPHIHLQSHQNTVPKFQDLSDVPPESTEA